MDSQIIVAILTSSVVGSVITKLFNFFDNARRSKKIDRILLLFVIKTLATEAIMKGYISSEDLQCLEDAYAEYKAIGGNGYAEH